ncbi:hypothetical protein NDU88_003459 [Pleurodeles waltl]|uniref:Uncharacterized protein n=1 Tax=Pleurodeles waltl TaxID=8319 RepID=A0AAV7LFW1_PLEWA|nr:hypothetical protein NDU88_003459 [Pleurodeles waltl]
MQCFPPDWAFGWVLFRLCMSSLTHRGGSVAAQSLRSLLREREQPPAARPTAGAPAQPAAPPGSPRARAPTSGPEQSHPSVDASLVSSRATGPLMILR